MRDKTNVDSPLQLIHPGFGYLEKAMPFNRDQLVLLLVAVNEIFLGLDTYLSHRISGTIVVREWIPVFFGPVAGTALLIAGLVAVRYRRVASTVASLFLLASFIVGLLGAYYHFSYAVRPAAPAGYRVTLPALIWAPPVLGPLSFSLVGWLGISAVFREEPEGSGTLVFLDSWHVTLPYRKSRAYYFIVSLGGLIALISSVLDHARHGFDHPWMWLTMAAGLFASLSAFGLGCLERPNRGDFITYFSGMVLLLLLGPIGLYYHAMANLTEGGHVVIERFIRGAPLMAPFLFSNIGLMGLIVLFPASTASEDSN